MALCLSTIRRLKENSRVIELTHIIILLLQWDAIIVQNICKITTIDLSVEGLYTTPPDTSVPLFQTGKVSFETWDWGVDILIDKFDSLDSAS